MPWVDLHVHSRYSGDADWSPAALVRELHRLGATGMALTDHDTTAGLREAWEAARELAFWVIPGVEISAHWQDVEMHILGYGGSVDEPLFQALLRRARALRWERTLDRIEHLQRLGYVIDPQTVGYGSDQPPPVGPRLAQWVLAHPANWDRFARTVRGEFHTTPPEVVFYHQFIKSRRERLHQTFAVEEVFETFQAVGVKPVLAHPGAPHYYVPDEIIRQLVSMGLVGIEVFSTYHTAAERHRLQAIARATGLVITGGSDFHGSVKPHVRLHEQYGVSVEVLEVLSVCPLPVT